MSIVSKALFFGRLLKAKTLGEQVPLFAFFTLTNRCNARCPYCFAQYYDRYDEEKDREMNTEQILGIIDQLEAMGTRRIGFSGGEPLLRDDIGTILRHAMSRGMECGLNTNGFLVPKKIDAIRGVGNVTISLDGDEKAHDANRGKGTYKKALRGIETVLEAGLPLHVSCVLSANNVDSIPYLMEMAKRDGFQLQISPLYTPFWGSSQPEGFPQALTPEEQERAIQTVLDFKDRGYPVFYSRQTYHNILAWPDPAKDYVRGEVPDFDHVECFMGRFVATIDASGDVYPCANLSGVDVKNALEVGMEEAFKHIKDHDCRACRWACYNEYNLLCSLDAGVIWNTVKKILPLNR